MTDTDELSNAELAAAFSEAQRSGKSLYERKSLAREIVWRFMQENGEQPPTTVEI